MRRGHTLLELSAVLALIAVATSAFLSVGRGLRDRAAVVAAREAVAGLFAEARVAALTWGGAEVHVRTSRAADAEVWYEAGGVVRRRVAFDAVTGIRLELSRGVLTAELGYDALGLGKVASETFRFRRRDVERTLVVSGYGRVRRW